MRTLINSKRCLICFNIWNWYALSLKPKAFSLKYQLKFDPLSIFFCSPIDNIECRTFRRKCIRLFKNPFTSLYSLGNRYDVSLKNQNGFIWNLKIFPSSFVPLHSTIVNFQRKWLGLENVKYIWAAVSVSVLMLLSVLKIVKRNTLLLCLLV